jgi:hypothetical protein
VELAGFRTHIRKSGLRRFLHYIAQLAGQCEAAFSLHDGGLDKKDLAPDWCPSKPGCYTRFVLFHLGFAQELGRT